MKHLSITAAALSLGLLCTPVTFAATSALGVSGTVYPGACDMVVDLPNGEINYGNIPSSSLNIGVGTNLPEKRYGVEVHCVQPTKIAFKWADNIGVSAVPLPGVPAEAAYGLGYSPRGIKIGSYKTIIASLEGDGEPMFKLSEVSPGVWDTPLLGGVITSDRIYSGANMSASLSQPTSVRTLAMQLIVESTIAGHLGMTFDQKIALRGSAVLEMIYI